MKLMTLAMVVLMLAFAGCGGDSDSDSDSGAQQDAPPPTQKEAAAPPEQDKEKKASGTTVEISDSEFGPMLFDSNNQAIYIFENDPKNETVCYDECAAAWPPVFTDGEPQAGEGVDKSLLGTIKRKDGKSQVTYAGKPLYFYANEKPGEVRCHNVNLNGGLWWVVGADGKRRP